jgi:hypothetical protein
MRVIGCFENTGALINNPGREWAQRFCSSELPWDLCLSLFSLN